MANRPDIDLARAGMLLNLIRDQAQVVPRLTHLSALAHSELLEMDEEAQAWADEVAKEKAEAEAEAKAAEAERVAAEQAEADRANAASAGRTAQAKAIPAKDLEPAVTKPAAPVVRRT